MVLPRSDNRLISMLVGVTLLAGCTGNDNSASPGPVPPCVHFEDYVRLLAIVDTPGDTRRAARRDDVVYVADGLSGIQVVDVQDPTDPFIIGTIAGGDVADVTIDSTFLYVATRDAGIAIYDISSPFPTPVGQLNSSGQSLGIAAVDTLLFVANDGIGLQVISVRDPVNPKQIGAENTPGEAQDVVVAGDFAYVSDGMLGVRTIFIANPSGPLLRGTLSVAGTGGIAIKDETVYIATRASGIHVIDVSRPDSLAYLRAVPMPGGATDIDVAGDRAFVADRFKGVQVLDVATPTQPERIATVAVTGDAQGVNIAGDLLLVSAPRADSGFKIVDVSNPNPPPILTVQPIPDPQGRPRTVLRIGGALYICNGAAGVQIADVRDAESITFEDVIPLAGARDIVMQDDIAYVAGETMSLAVNVSDPFEPLVLTTVLPLAERIAVNDSLIFLAQGRAGVSVYRILTPGIVEFVRNIDSTAFVFAFDVAMSGDFGYIAWGTAGLHIVDLRRLHLSSGFVGALPTDFAAKAVVVVGSYALVAQQSKLDIADVRLPATPSLVGVAPAPGNPVSLTAFGATAYVSGGPDGLQLIDISDPTKPIPSGTLNLGGSVMGADADDLFLYAVDQDNGLIVTGAQCE